MQCLLRRPQGHTLAHVALLPVALVERGCLAQESSGTAGEGKAGAPAGPARASAPDEGDGEGPGIAAEADAGEPAARRTAVVEQCCAWGGEQRLRLRLTLSVGPGARALAKAGRPAGGLVCTKC